MAYWIHAKIKDSDGAFSVVVGTAKDALAKLAELAELDQSRGRRYGPVGHNYRTGDLAG